LDKDIFQSHKKNANMLLPMMDLQGETVGMSGVAGLAATD
jgi:hypothetical protein